MKDYPAAHSMDSCWFAVDADGCVGYFDTDEGGCLPMGGFPLGGEAGGYGDDSFELWQLVSRLLVARAQTDDRLRSMLPEDIDQHSEAIEAELEVELLARYLGVYVYHSPEAWAAPYARGGLVRSAIRIEQLDAETRARFVDCALPVKFAEALQVQPARYRIVSAWGDVWCDLDGSEHPTEREPPESLADEELGRSAADDWVAEAEFGELADDEAFYATVQEVFGG